MLSERLQILISPEQRRRLDAEALRRGEPVAALVREAIDASLARPTPAERREAFEAIAAMKGRYLTPEEIEAVIDEERDRIVAPRDR
ncbi:MAG: antitoxin [Actinobacteria bacterium]|nr:antitoxin [Actinomycetota bacterium]